MESILLLAYRGRLHYRDSAVLHRESGQTKISAIHPTLNQRFRIGIPRNLLKWTAENVKESEGEERGTVECQECGRVTDDSDAMCCFCREDLEQDD
jgi:hypothetical protein